MSSETPNDGEHGDELSETEGASSSKLDGLVDLALELGDPFHDEMGRPHIAVPDGNGTRPIRVPSLEAKRWLQQIHRERVGRYPAGPSVSGAAEALAAHAVLEGPEVPVHLRVARHGDAICIDLGGPGPRTVVIRDGGWEIADRSPVHFRRTPTARSLPWPDRDGEFHELAEFLNVASEEDFMLLVGYLVGAWHPEGPYPILVVEGEQGSTKTTLARVIKELVDPADPSIRSLPRSERDLAVAADGTHLLAFDNLAGVAPWMSDALCRLSTGGGIATRQLYTDSEETVFRVRRPVLVNGLEAIASRQDLLDRALVVTLPRLDSAHRKSEEEFWARFAEVKPRILGALVNAVAAAHAGAASVDLSHLPRMADFARFVTAAEDALRFPSGAFLEAYERNRSMSLRTSLDGSLVAAAVLRLVELEKNHRWEGTPTELHERLTFMRPDHVRVGRGWPANAQSLSKSLTLISPALREYGIEISMGHLGRGRDKVRWIEIYDQQGIR